MARAVPVFAAILIGLAACGRPAAPPPPPAPVAHTPTFTQSGLASWYGDDHAGKKTADGERFDPHALTAAHRSLPFGTVARVTNVQTGKSVKVRITDRGPYERRRIIDVSAAAAAVLGIHRGGVVPVRVEVFAGDQPPTEASLQAK